MKTKKLIKNNLDNESLHQMFSWMNKYSNIFYDWIDVVICTWKNICKCVILFERKTHWFDVFTECQFNVLNVYDIPEFRININLIKLPYNTWLSQVL